MARGTSGSKTPASPRATSRHEQPPPERRAPELKLIELRPGLFINGDQIVLVRVLQREEGDVYAVLQLSNGDKLDLTRAEFTAISREEPRLAPQRRQMPTAQ